MEKTEVYLTIRSLAIPAKLQSATSKAKRLDTRTIEVVEFLDNLLDHLDERRYGDCYFLTPQDTGVKAFYLFLTAMRQGGVVAVAKLTYEEQELLAVVRPYNGAMLLQTYILNDELVDEPEQEADFVPIELVEPEQKATISEVYRQIELTRKLIRQMTIRPYTDSILMK